MSWTQTLPEGLAALNAVEPDWEQMDWEPNAHFDAQQETLDWLRAWTGNDALQQSPLRVFGRDGTGGQAAIWVVDPHAPLHEQPVVFFGSEGATAVIAQTLADFAWLLAGGVGPMEATEYGAEGARPHRAYQAIAQRHFPDAQQRPERILSQAAAAYPGFSAWVEALCP